MRKLRKDITLAEAREGWEIRGGVFSKYCDDLWRNIQLGIRAMDFDYPDSFYEQSPIGSFGRFYDNDTEPGKGCYSYLLSINHHGRYVDEYEELPWDHFTPGLPTDVDADGYPKEEK
jgi:hypothetical protein